MILYQCDLCKNQMSAQAEQPEAKTMVSTKNGLHEVGVRVIRSIDGAWNGGHICGSCMGQALHNMAIQLEQS